MSTNVEITVGLLSIIFTIAVMAVLGANEEDRMLEASRGYYTRSVETGAVLFDQYCASCHGVHASGANCPPLDETSGLHGGEAGEGVAWRLEEQHWDRTNLYGYVKTTIEFGRPLSSRPERFKGLDPNAMQMPAWSQENGGPLRPDEIKDLTNYIVNFNAYYQDEDYNNLKHLDACQKALKEGEGAAEYATYKPYVEGYDSKCFEVICVDDYMNAGVEPPVAPVKAEYTDGVGEIAAEDRGDPAAIAESQKAIDAALEVYATDEAAYWKEFWRGCKAVGGRIPESAMPSPTPTEAPEEDEEAEEGDDLEGDDSDDAEDTSDEAADSEEDASEDETEDEDSEEDEVSDDDADEDEEAGDTATATPEPDDEG